jgi:ribosome maturation factor RimP
MKKSIDDLIDEIRKVIEPVISALGIEIDDIEFGRMKGRSLLRVYIEKEGGVTIDDCERVSREIEAVLDVEDPIPYSYVLEVSSPGLDRPLRSREDFKRYAGRMVRVITRDPIEKQTFFVGKLVEAGDVDVALLLENNKKVAISYDNISRARLEVEV